ncbi:MAG: hypothetical protein AAF738_01490 [Bacteroidota bacterium]
MNKNKNNLDLGATLKNKKKAPKDVRKIERAVAAVHTEPTKRLTLEVSLSLHAKIKAYAAAEGSSIKEFVTGLIQDKML